jgi:ATP-dependent Clp protease ATP-binding subunit ClpC
MHLEEALSERVLGQEAAIKEVAEAVRTARAGLKKANRPIGVFLFLGSTGIGKTELAKVLAQSLFGSEDALIRFDMSEFSEKHNVARLIGAPPGYIGYGEEGQLTGKVRTRPYCVVLFDEVEKAHPSVFDIFLQMLDEGQLTDAMGRRALLTESIIILTSNLGTGPDDRPKRAIGIRMGDEEHVSSDAYRRSIEQAVQRAFRPELLNRITHRIVFSPLTKAVMLQILDKLIAQLKTMLQGKSFAVEFSDQAKDFLLQEGHWDVYGARELERTFERLITTPLAREILEGKSDVGATICVAVAKGRLSFLKGDASRE